MTRFLCALLLSALVLFGADVTGKWSGDWENGPDGGPGPHYMVLKQDGAKVTGTAGPNAERQFDISNGKIAGDVLTFDVVLGGGAMTMKFEFKVAGDAASGTAKMESQGQSQTLKLSVKRV